MVKSAHDISEGGLIVTLLEIGFNRDLGFNVHAATELRTDAYWFGEAQSRVVVTCSKQQADTMQHKAAAAGIPVTVLGNVTASEINVNGEAWGSISEWKEKYDTAIEKLLV